MLAIPIIQFGPTGGTGPQGTQGTQGSIGIGLPGLQGNQGTQGSIGVQGTQGSIGVQGTQGSQGSAGTGNALRSPVVTVVSGVTGVVPDISTTDIEDLINIASGCTIYAPSGTPNNGQRLVVRIANTATGATSYSTTWVEATGFTARLAGPTLPTRTTTGTGAVHHHEFMYNTNGAMNRWCLILRTS